MKVKSKKSSDISSQLLILTHLVEESARRPLKTPADFSYMSGMIEERTKEMLSVSTLKRIWGYVDGVNIPSNSTRSILARFVGFRDWDDFVANYCENNMDSSKNLFSPTVLSAQLEVGTKLLIAWSPDRECLLSYLGGNRFEVVESRNAKVHTGDSFTCDAFTLNQPLYVSGLLLGGQAVDAFVMGNRGGLTKIERII